MILLGLIFSPVSEISAQSRADADESRHDYRNACGIRAGRTSGVTFKHFLSSGNAIELIGGFWPNAIGLTGLYQKHQSVGLAGLKFYYGVGGHATAEMGSYYYRKHGQGDGPYRYRYGEKGFAAGIDGVAGLDYKIGIVPLAISLDLKPFVEVSNYGVIYTALDAGLGIKLAF